MKEDNQIKILELIDDGATLESSSELKALVEASDEATKFYESVLVSEAMLESFFGEEKARQIDNKIDTLVEEKLTRLKPVPRFNFKPVIGFAVAASLAVIALIFIEAPSNVGMSLSSDKEKQLYGATEYVPELIVVEESEPLVISGAEMNTLWSTASEIADELGLDRYEVMYVVYKGNKDSFVDNNIHQPRQDKDYFVDLSLIEDLETQFIVNEVKRHIYCRC